MINVCTVRQLLETQTYSRKYIFPGGNYFTIQICSQEEDLEEKEEPDRLTELLPQSKFSCNGKKTGYYADDGLNCEVFHYCQDNARHSWICPEGFSFHQVSTR